MRTEDERVAFLYHFDLMDVEAESLGQADGL